MYESRLTPFSINMQKTETQNYMFVLVTDFIVTLLLTFGTR